MITLATIDEAIWNFGRDNYGMRPGYILCHPEVRNQLFASYKGTWICDPKVAGKPDTVMGLELVVVDPRNHPEDFFKLVGPAPAPEQKGRKA